MMALKVILCLLMGAVGFFLFCFGTAWLLGRR